MKRPKNQTIGILGGMGPDATSLFFKRIIQYTPVHTDQEHLKIIIYNNPEIPDRTEAIVNNKESPVEKVKEGIKFLENSIVDFIAIPCVTIHYFFDEIVSSVNIPVLNLVEETALYIKEKYPDSKKIGILATMGTFKRHIFEKIYHKENFITIVPNERGQENLMKSIYGKEGIKAGFISGYPKDLILKVVDDLIGKGAEVIVGGCTEIPIVIAQDDIKVPFIDSLTVLAKAAIRKAGLVPKPI